MECGRDCPWSEQLEPRGSAAGHSSRQVRSVSSLNLKAVNGIIESKLGYFPLVQILTLNTSLVFSIMHFCSHPKKVAVSRSYSGMATKPTVLTGHGAITEW